MSPILRFLGGTGTVTGSRFLLETGRARVLLDCGLFQGLKQLRLRNWAAFPVEPASIDAVVLSHAHLDHSGYLPSLVKQGFAGPIFATSRTVDLCRILLPDSGRLQEEDAAYVNRRGFSKHTPALPLYDEEDAERALRRIRSAGPEPREVAPGVRVAFRNAGHILGSASLHVSFDDGEAGDLLVSGDLGRPRHPVLEPPEPLPAVRTLLIESTYGDRCHDDSAALAAFAEAIVRTAARGGLVLIPAFAVDRTEVVLYHLRQLTAEGKIPELPVYVDSPMALAALRVYREAVDAGEPEVRSELRGHPEPFDPGGLVEARAVEASKAIHDAALPAIVISASGMLTGGRVLHHLARRLPDPTTTVILVGFQAEGTRGRRLLEGAESIKLLGRYVPVRADVVEAPVFSVHADADELAAWVATAPEPPDTIYVVHGEKAAAAALRDRLASSATGTVVVPSLGERVRLD